MCTGVELIDFASTHRPYRKRGFSESQKISLYATRRVVPRTFAPSPNSSTFLWEKSFSDEEGGT